MKAYILFIFFFIGQIHATTDPNNLTNQQAILINSQNQIASNVLQMQQDAISKIEWQKKLKIIKIAAICIGISVALVGGTLLAFYIYKKASQSLLSPSKEETEALEKTETIATEMNNNLGDVKRQLGAVTKNNQIIKGGIETAMTEIKTTRDVLANLRNKCDDKRTILKIFDESLRELTKNEQQIVALYKSTIRDSTHMTKLYREQNQTINQLLQKLEKQDKEIKGMKFQQKLDESTRNALIEITLKNKTMITKVNKETKNLKKSHKGRTNSLADNIKAIKNGVIVWCNASQALADKN